MNTVAFVLPSIAEPFGRKGKDMGGRVEGFSLQGSVFDLEGNSLSASWHLASCDHLQPEGIPSVGREGSRRREGTKEDLPELLPCRQH